MKGHSVVVVPMSKKNLTQEVREDVIPSYYQSPSPTPHQSFNLWKVVYKIRAAATEWLSCFVSLLTDDNLKYDDNTTKSDDFLLIIISHHVCTKHIRRESERTMFRLCRRRICAFHFIGWWVSGSSSSSLQRDVVYPDPGSGSWLFTHPGSWSWIPDLESRGQRDTVYYSPDPGSRIRIRNTGDFGFAQAVGGSVSYWLLSGAAVLTTYSMDQLSEASPFYFI